MALAALGAFVGHLYPVFFRFQGGKGVATFIGAVFGVHWLLGIATGLTWLIIAFFFRYSSLASLVAAVFAPVYYLLGHRARVVRRSAGGGRPVRHGGAAGLAASREHPPAAGRHRIAPGRQEGLSHRGPSPHDGAGLVAPLQHHLVVRRGASGSG